MRGKFNFIILNTKKNLLKKSISKNMIFLIVKKCVDNHLKSNLLNFKTLKLKDLIRSNPTYKQVHKTYQLKIAQKIFSSESIAHFHDLLKLTKPNDIAVKMKLFLEKRRNPSPAVE